jgi:hypothetical protein
MFVFITIKFSDLYKSDRQRTLVLFGRVIYKRVFFIPQVNIYML